jgi:hypothetical protein
MLATREDPEVLQEEFEMRLDRLKAQRDRARDQLAECSAALNTLCKEYLYATGKLANSAYLSAVQVLVKIQEG